MAAKKILHIDFDSFFASVEQQHRPQARNKPIGVTAANSRTCIIASSREAKRLGIKTGARSYEALKICPELILVPADFNKYFDVSKKFLNICKDYSPFVELFSIDEVFMDVTLTANLFGGTSNFIQTMKQRIKNEIGDYITASFGVSHNKLLAKLASGFNKPNARLLMSASPHAKQTRLQAPEAQADGGQGFFEITPQNIWDIYQKAKLTDICGIGERIRRRLNDVGVSNLIQLRNAPLELLIKEFGNIEGHFLKSVGLGIDENEVIPYTQPQEVKSVGRSYCLPRNESNKKIVLQNLYELCEEVGIKLRRLGKKGKTIGLGLNGSSYIKARKTFKGYVDSGSQIYNLIFPLIEEDFKNQKYVRQIHIWVSGLEDKERLTLPLFDFEEKKDRIVNTIDKLNNKFGDHTIRNGFLLYADKLTTVPNGYLADRYERSKLVQGEPAHYK